MASDTGAAKAKNTLKDSSSVERDNTRENSRPISTTAQRDTSVPTQNSSTFPSVQRDNSSAQTSNSASDAGKNSSLHQANSVNVPVNPENRRLRAELHSKVAHRAYELYQQNGIRHGDDLHHWLRAESEILERIPEVHQTDSTYSVITRLNGFGPGDISVTIEPNRALILADKQQSSDANGFANPDGSLRSRHSVFFVADWPGQVDPATATAQLKQGNLVLTVRRAGTISEDLKSPQIAH